MIKKVCDICGEEIKPETTGMSFAVTFNPSKDVDLGRDKPVTMDLCVDCKHDLLEFVGQLSALHEVNGGYALFTEFMEKAEKLTDDIEELAKK